MPFLTQPTLDAKADHGHDWTPSGISAGQGVPALGVRSWGDDIVIRYAGTGSVPVSDVTDGKEFTVGSLKVRYRTLASIEFPSKTVWTPEGEIARIDVILASVPAVAYWDFEITGPGGMRFLYQPALSPGDISEGAVRPDWCVGSYALYAKDGRKLGHFPRPFAVDAAGKWTWGTLTMPSSGVLRKSIDAAWLATAAYPVTVDDTYGTTSIGGTNISLLPDYVMGFDLGGGAPADGSATSVSVYLTNLINTPVTLGIYDHDAGGANNLLRDSAGANESDGWVTQALDSALNLSSGTTYHTAWNHDSRSLFMHYDTDASYDDNGFNASVYSAGALPNPFPAAPSLRLNEKYSTYITYTPAVAGIARRVGGAGLFGRAGNGGGLVG